MRTSIKLTSPNEVTLTAIDPFSGEEIKWIFSIPANGGYVRRGHRQVCERLSRLGHTLICENGDDLLNTIRGEWKKYRADAS